MCAVVRSREYLNRKGSSYSKLPLGGRRRPQEDASAADSTCSIYVMYSSVYTTVLIHPSILLCVRPSVIPLHQINLEQIMPVSPHSYKILSELLC